MSRPIPQDRAFPKRARATWSSGRVVTGGPLDGQLFSGWYVDTDESDELNTAAADAGFALGKLDHLDGQREHWLMPDAIVYMLIDGVPFTSVSATSKSPLSAQCGIRCSWPKSKDEQGNILTAPDGKPFRSRLSVKGLPRDLLLAGYTEAVQFSVSSTQTDDLLNALMHHELVLQAAEKIAAHLGRVREIPYWKVGVPFTKGQRVSRGKDATSQIFPIDVTYPSIEVMTNGLLVADKGRILDGPAAAESGNVDWQRVEKALNERFMKLAAPRDVDLQGIYDRQMDGIREWASRAAAPVGDEHEYEEAY